MSNVKLDISWEIDEEKRLENMIIETAKAALELEGAKCDVDLSVVVTDNENIREINNEQRNIDRATDVLSFPGYEKDEWNELKKNEELVYIGDIVISKEKVEEQAKEYGHSFEREFCYLVAHGMLHLMGYDHMVDSDKVIMRGKEEEIMKKLNLEREECSEKDKKN